MVRLELVIDSRSSMNGDCKVPRNALDALTRGISQVDLAEGGGSAQVKKLLASKAQEEGWESDFLVSNAVSKDFPDANFKINYLWVSQNCPCGVRHKVFAHRCFDNRQAIGTNLLRFMVASLSRTKSQNDDYTFAAIVADEKAKRLAWDNAIGSYEEYFFAINGGYEAMMLPPVDFLVIRG